MNTQEDIVLKEVSPFDQFQELIVSLKTAEEKIRLSLKFMKEAISEKHFLRFRDFWEIKKICLPFFRGDLPSQLRSQLWNEYVEISSEGKHLKDSLDEQSAFIVEQLDLAIHALEKDLANKDSIIAELPPSTPLIQDTVYDSLQRELYWLGTMVTRINGLRKEIIKTEMRARIKNKLFERLSKVGDSIFPRRKELIKQVSEQFLVDIQAFETIYFKEPLKETLSLFNLKTEIKKFQALAKNLTLDTQGFNQTREILGQCWNVVRQKEDVYKLQKQEALSKSVKEDQEKNAHLELLQKQKREKIESFRSEVEQLIDSVSEHSLESISKQKDALHSQLRALSLTSSEKEFLESLLKVLRDKILDKKEKSLSNLSQDEQKSLAYLNSKLAEGLSQRSEIKSQIEGYRKALSGSDFDFAKAMLYREMLEAEKIRLEKVNLALEDIEDKISALENCCV